MWLLGHRNNRKLVGAGSALSIIEPMSATIFSVILFDEKLGVFSVIGIVLILGAVYLIGKHEDK